MSSEGSCLGLFSLCSQGSFIPSTPPFLCSTSSSSAPVCCMRQHGRAAPSEPSRRSTLIVMFIPHQEALMAVVPHSLVSTTFPALLLPAPLSTPSSPHPCHLSWPPSPALHHHSAHSPHPPSSNAASPVPSLMEQTSLFRTLFSGISCSFRTRSGDM